MIFGTLQNLEKELEFYPLGLQKGFKFLLETDLAALAIGKHEVEGSNIVAIVSEYETQPKEVRRAERHDKKLDIQYICSGEEMIGSAPLAAAGEVGEDCLSTRDVIFYKSVASETELILTAGMFAVYFPWDVHRPNCSVQANGSKIRKIVMKIDMDVLHSK